MKLSHPGLFTVIFLLGCMVSYSQGDRCSSIQPFCAGNSQLIFPNSNPQGGGLPNAAQGPDFGCLSTQPYPAWYYLQIGTSGDLRFTISQSENQDGSGRQIDVDFIVWGPFDVDDDYCSNSSLTALNTVDCSYEPFATETMFIPNAQAGKIYIVMITNYDEIPGYISLQQTNTGGGSTDCSIVGSTLGPDRKLCGEEEVVLDATNAQASKYEWSVYNENTGTFEVIDNETGPTLTVNQSGNYQVTVISEFFGSEESDQVMIEFFDIPVANVPSVVYGCATGDMVSYDLTGASDEITGGNTDLSVKFYLTTQDIENGNSIAGPSGFQGNVSNVLATVTSQESGCESSPVTVALETAQPPSFEWSNFIPVCTDAAGNFLTSVTIGSDLGDDYTYNWNLSNDSDGDGTQDGVLILNQYPPGGIVTLELVNTITGCIYNYTSEVRRLSPPIDIVVEISGNDFETNGYSVFGRVLDDNSGSAVYEYRLNSGSWQNDQQFDRVPGGTHTITAREVNGCGSVTSSPFRLIGYPRFFTPNGDGYNDTWNVVNDESLSISKVIIFDRYGKLIKELNPSSGGWDGTFNGYALPADDYWFLVNYRGNGTVFEEYKGNFSLKR